MSLFQYKVKGVSRGGPGVPVTPSPLCKPFFKQTTYNIPWRKRHDDIVLPSVTTPLKNPGYAPEGLTWSNPLSGMDRIIREVSNPKPVRKPAHSSATSYMKHC